MPGAGLDLLGADRSCVGLRRSAGRPLQQAVGLRHRCEMHGRVRLKFFTMNLADFYSHVNTKKTDPGLCTSNEGRFLKVFKRIFYII